MKQRSGGYADCSVYYVSAAIPGTGDKGVNQTDLALIKLIILEGRREALALDFKALNLSPITCHQAEGVISDNNVNVL